jgi:DNA-binding CsgD family transcriptional regulator
MRERGIVRELLDRLPGQGGALVVRGEAGIGKSALVAEAARRAQADGFQILIATGVQSETHLPFAGLHQLLRPIQKAVDALPGPQRGAMAAAFGRSTAAPPDLFLIALASLDVLADVGDHSPVVLVAEDAQWLDGPTCDVLAFVARRLESDPIVVLLAVRDGWPTSLLDAGLPELRLEGLSASEAGALIDLRTPGLVPAVRRRLLDEAQGNPLALVELPAALGASRLTGEEPLPAALPLTARLERTFTARAIGLPAHTQTTLLVAAIDDGTDLAEVLTAASDVAKTEATVDALAPAVSAGLIEIDQTEVHFHHPLVRSAIQQLATASERRAVHAALAAVLVDQPDRRAWHRAAAMVGPNEEVAGELADAALRAQARGALFTAVSALERAAQLSPDGALRGQRLLLAAELAFELGRRDLVARLVREAEPLTSGPLEEARMAWIRGISGSTTFDAERIRHLVETAERARQAGDTDLAFNIIWLVAQRCWWSDPGWTAREHVIAAAERASTVDGDPRVLTVFAYAAPIERGSVVTRWVAQASSTAESDAELARAYGSAASVVGSFELAPRFLVAAVDGLRAQGRLGHLPRLLLIQAWDGICLGDWTTALSASDEAQRLAAETAEPFWVAGAQAMKAVLIALRGELELAATLATAAERVLLPVGPNFLLAIVQAARGVAALGNGRHAEAYQELRRIYDTADPAYHPVIGYWVIADLAEAAAHSGDRDPARALVQRVASAIWHASSRWCQIEVRYANALLANDEAAETEFQGTLAEDIGRWPFLRGRVLLSYGAWLRRQRRVADARAPLRAARQAFDALGAIAWGERARQELRASGEVSERRTPEAREQLSPQELQIASMAAQGLSNREIGQKLYLSHRTVASHLYRVFPKLGITSRAHLGRVLVTS